MKVKVVFSLVLAAVLSFAVPAPAQGGPVNAPPPQSALRDAIVQVRGGGVIGSGTLVWSDRQIGVVLTAAHVIKQHRSVPVIWRTGYLSLGHVLAADSSSDLAAILVQPPLGAPVIRVSDIEELPSRGEQVTLAGYGGGTFRAWGAGVRGYKRIPHHKQHGQWILTDVGLSAIGDSGGPILYRQRLVGVISRGIRPARSASGLLTCGPETGVIRSFCQSAFPHAFANDVTADFCSTAGTTAARESLGALTVAQRHR